MDEVAYANAVAETSGVLRRAKWRIAELEAERDSLLLWITENLTVEQVHAATSFVLSRRLTPW